MSSSIMDKLSNLLHIVNYNMDALGWDVKTKKYNINIELFMEKLYRRGESIFRCLQF